MSSYRVFNQLVEQLIKQYSETPPAIVKDERNIYRFYLENDIKIHVLSDEKDYLHMVGFWPVPAKPLSQSALSKLLKFNQFTPNNPFYVIGVDPEAKEMSLHVRQPMIELDNRAAFQLFEDVIDKVTTLQRWLTDLSR